MLVDSTGTRPFYDFIDEADDDQPSSGDSDTDSYYNSWQEAEQATRTKIRSVESRKERTFSTPYGNRVVDAYNPDTGVIAESQYGHQGLTAFIQTEIERDSWLLKNEMVSSVEWHFYYSIRSNSCGPSKPLYRALEEAGFIIIIN